MAETPCRRTVWVSLLQRGAQCLTVGGLLVAGGRRTIHAGEEIHLWLSGQNADFHCPLLDHLEALRTDHMLDPAGIL